MKATVLIFLTLILNLNETEAIDSNLIKIIGLKKNYCIENEKIKFKIKNEYKIDKILISIKMEKMGNTGDWYEFCSDIMHEKGVSDMVMCAKIIKPGEEIEIEFYPGDCEYPKKLIENEYKRDFVYTEGKYRLYAYISKYRKALLGRTYDKKEVILGEFNILKCK